MPLCERKPFKRIKPPKDLRPNEELFYIATTQEVFRNYNDFFERVIHINSLIWSCSMTGKSGLTYQEALDSEAEARDSLKLFPHALKKPLLYLASLTERKRLNDLCDDVFNYVKDRYFIGEEVEVTVNGVKRSCEVTQVILPERAVKTPSKAENSKPRKQKDIAPSKIKYEVVDYGSGRTSVVKADNLSRPKGTFTKPKNKLYLKQQTQPKDGSWKVKDAVMAKQEIEEFNFEEVHCGPLPSYVKEKLVPTPKKSQPAQEKSLKGSAKKAVNDQTGKKTVQGKLNFKKESVEEKNKNVQKEALLEKQRIAEEKERQKKRDLIKKQIEEEKEKQRTEKINERLKKKEEKRIMAEYLNSWKKPRDDLECDDLKDLPVPMPVDCGIPQKCVGDSLMILEFLSTFEKQISVKDVFPQGCTIEHIEKALTETDIQGVFNDLLQLFLTAIFKYQEADDDVIDFKEKVFQGLDNLTLDKAAEVGSIVMNWPQKQHGTHLRNIPLDSFSITEILRLHILSSGGKPRVNWQGIVGRSEDPGLFFKVEETELLKKLESSSVFDLDCEEKCKIINLLMNQLLCTDVLKYAIDENADKTRPLRHQLKQLRWAYSRKEKDVSSKKKPQIKEIKEGDSEEPQEVTPVPVEEEEKENADNLSPEEKAELEEKKAKEAAKQKAEFQRKEREIEQQIRKLQSSFNVAPLGRDRAYRRYWVFQTVPGIFVEDDDDFKGSCLPKLTIQNPYPNANNTKSETSTNSIKKYLQNIETKSASSDKENEILREIAIVQSEFPFPTKNRKLTDLNPRVDLKKGATNDIMTVTEDEGCLLCKNKVDVQGDINWYCPHSKNNLPTDQCSANIDTCPVHNTNAPRMKWAFFYKEEDIDDLIGSLNSRGFRERSLREALLSEKEHLKETIAKCPYNSFNKMLIPEVRKSQRLQYQKSSYADMTPRQALELTIRDMILELEHRISAGGLGSLKIESPESWRTAIEQGALHLQIDRASKDKDCDATVKEEISLDIKNFTSPIPYEQAIKDLAQATLQLSQGIEAKYLNSPLGDSDDKKSKQKVSEDTESQKKKSLPIKKSPLERWQESLLQCKSLSQLYVHLGTLERSVAWSRSVLKAHCRICRRRGDGENMLLCDGCNRGHHLYCLKPPLKAIPEGDWFCLACKPVEKIASPQKKLKKVESDSEEEQSDDDEDVEEEEESEEEADESVAENEAIVQESCEKCGDVGTLLCCDRCPLMYHQECVNLKRIPRGEWLCPKCTKKEEALKKAQKHPASGSYGTRSSSLTSDNKKGSNPLKNKPISKGTKRKYEDSFEEEFEPPTKRSNRERRSRTENADENENPFRKVYRGSRLPSNNKKAYGLRNNTIKA
ncbi:bromodomain adjacent to zinc finger domain protein 1A isoform X6 [Parasteatoda tepidariorum]|uniref:bromodomain adjacent to zinc finger domain protein 1A isoform X6 n=1 Tax=Parasteatoda tepidariorum TaxID=114398 RepID=UPI00077FC371|nr:bromodomain adjacent to zinc finger domain protein 1A isoform X5 [Parasteatoda tepidariorum]